MKNKKLIMILMATFVVLTNMTSVAFADGGVIGQIGNRWKIPWDDVFNIVSPALFFVMLGIGILGVIIIVGTLVVIGIWTLNSIRGKDSWNKKKIGVVVTAVVVGLLMTGTGWIKIFGFIDSTVVKPGENTINKQEENNNENNDSSSRRALYESINI
ncbi:hypothetical protein [Sporosalibacterium faouarense]|uniref:hypothetical protein n=1 Tax=Sporosalibacterium faouarense TaxID=516123 RepID=UPI00192BDD6F|nr:hypothetical protein [Sporosalibacterium faouarense]